MVSSHSNALLNWVDDDKAACHDQTSIPCMKKFVDSQYTSTSSVLWFAQ